MKKEYKCCICKKVLDYKPIRLIRQEYYCKKYNQYAPIERYDFCKECYDYIENYLVKHNAIRTKV